MFCHFIAFIKTVEREEEMGERKRVATKVPGWSQTGDISVHGQHLNP